MQFDLLYWIGIALIHYRFFETGVRGSPYRGMGETPNLFLKGVQGPSPAGGMGVSPTLLSPRTEGVRGHSPAGGMGVSPITLIFLAPPFPYWGEGAGGVGSSLTAGP